MKGTIAWVSVSGEFGYLDSSTLEHGGLTVELDTSKRVKVVQSDCPYTLRVGMDLEFVLAPDTSRTEAYKASKVKVVGGIVPTWVFFASIVTGIILSVIIAKVTSGSWSPHFDEWMQSVADFLHDPEDTSGDGAFVLVLIAFFPAFLGLAAMCSASYAVLSSFYKLLSLRPY